MLKNVRSANLCNSHKRIHSNLSEIAKMESDAHVSTTGLKLFQVYYGKEIKAPRQTNVII